MKIPYATSKELRRAIKGRDPYSSKTKNGRLLIIGGSETYHGAPALAANAAYNSLAALRSGTGYVTVYVPRGILNVERGVSPNNIIRPLSGNHLNLNDFKMLANSINKVDCVVIGNGMGREADSLKCASKLINYAIKNSKNIIIDADGIYAIWKYAKQLNKCALLTPNEKEFGLFYRKEVSEKDINSRMEAAKAIARKLNCNLLLKGHNTVITDGKDSRVVRAKSAALATMGSGDVLAGLIGGFASRGNIFDSAVAAAYVHAAIGDSLHKKEGNHIIASDVVDCIPFILKKFEK